MSIRTQFPIILTKLGSKESWVLYLAMFVMGACGLAYEYTLSKVAGDILGNSVREWAIIIGTMMFFMGIGADLQKYLSDKLLVDYFIFFEILIGLAGAFGPISYIYAYGHFPLQFVLVKFFFIILIGLIIGFEIPLVSRINERFIAQLKVNLASVLKMDYVGSLVGALAWIFVLPLFFEQVQIGFVLGLLNVLVGGATFLFFRKMVRHRLRLLLFFLVSLAAIGYGLGQARGWRLEAEQYLYRDRIVFSQTTRYQHIVLTRDRADVFCCYINGHLQFNSADEFIYHENLVHPAMALARHKRNILILGGGDGMALREVLKYPQVRSVTLADLDPAMTDLAKNNPLFQRLNGGSLANSRVKVIENHALVDAGTTDVLTVSQNVLHGRRAEVTAQVNVINVDAVEFVGQVAGLYDVIILDFPDPNSVDLAKLYATQFYRQLKKILAVDGIIVQQSTSPYHAKEVFLSIGRSLEASGFAVLPYKDNVPSFGEWGWWLGGHEEYFSAAALRAGLADLAAIPVRTKYLTPEVVESNLVFAKGELETGENTVNSLANGMAFYYYLQSWRK